MESKMTQRKRIWRSIFVPGTFIAVLLAVMCPSLSRRASAHHSTGSNLYMQPLGEVGGLAFDGSAKSDAPATLTFTPDLVLNYSDSRGVATTTVGRGINSNGDIVGSYICAKNPNHQCGAITPGNHGFLILAGTTDYLPIDVPGVNVTATLPRAISEQGLVVGQYNVGSGNALVQHGFSCSSPCASSSDYVFPIDVSSDLFDAAEQQAGESAPRRSTLVVGVSPDGDLVGCYHEETIVMETMHGWHRRQGEFKELVTLGGGNDADTMNNGISPTGEIVGIYLTSGVSYIADENSIVEMFTYPGYSSSPDPGFFTLAWGVNARGDVVGERGDNAAYSGSQLGMCTSACADTNPAGFIRTRFGDYLTLKVQGARSTQIFGINAARDIVGGHVDSVGCGVTNCTHGFVQRLANSNQL
jgi:hypothetical protein